MRRLRSWLLARAGDVVLRGEVADLCYHLGREIQRTRALTTAAERAPGRQRALRAELAAARAELERWRHGSTIEGDYVCPDSLALAAARAEIARLRGGP